MRNKIIAVLLACAFMLNFAKPYRLRAYADAMTASMLGSVAYSIMQASGISFTAGSATGTGMDSFMAGQVESYVNSKGGSLTSLFGGEMARLAAGKLVVGQQMYNGIVNFVEWLKEKFELDSAGKILSYGSLSDIILNEGQQASTEIPSNGYGVVVQSPLSFDSEYLPVGYQGIILYKDGKSILTIIQSYGHYFNGSYNIEYLTGTKIRLNAVAIDPTSGHTRIFSGNTILNAGEIKNQLSWSVPENWSAPAPLPQDKQWEGDFTGTPGWTEPQDLPDFLSKIPVGIANNNLVVQEEVTSGPTPTPPPSPSPSPAPYPGLSIAQKIALILGEITAIMFDTKGDTADQTYQDIGEQVEQTTQEIAESITDPITQTQTQTQQQIIDSTQTITQTITDTQTQTQEKLEDITQTIEDTTSVPDQTSWDKVKKDLHGVFPFCIPWDIYGMLNAFNAEPRAPYFEYPFKIPSINLDYTLELDFKDFDPVAQTLRTVELIAFCVGLAILTSKVIRW